MEILKTIGEWAATTGVKIIIAIVILIVSFAVINAVAKKLKKVFEKNTKLDKTLVRVFQNAASVGLKVLVVMALVGYLGIDTSGIAAVVASLGVCVGLAVNGTLSNLAGGVMILITRPFKLGDFIEASGMLGTVEDIRICYTKIVTVDNKVIYLPNSGLSTGIITNYSEKDLRRVDLDFSVAGNDPDKVKEVLFAICKDTKTVVDEPSAVAPIVDYGAGTGMKIQLRAWCKSTDYWDTYFAILKAAEKEFGKNSITVPFSQLDVHIKND